MILEGQIQIFGALAAKFTFSKIPGGLNINMFFCENWHEASFYIKEQRRKTKSKLSFKNYFFGPPKKSVFGF